MFYGWKIVGVAFLTHFVSVGFLFYSYGVFFKVWVEEFGGERTDVAVGLSIMNLAVAVLSPKIGHMFDYRSIRNLMGLGALALGVGFILGAYVGNLWQLYVVLGTIMGFGQATLGAVASSTLVGNWFDRRRGTALGVATMGISLSGMVMAPVTTRLIEAYGWRATFLIFGAICIVLVFPIVWFIVINRPEDIDQLPDGAPPERLDDMDATESGANSIIWTTGSTLLSLNYWIIASVIGLALCGTSAVLVHMIPHATDLGFSPHNSAWVLSICAGLGVFGKLFFGWITDRVDQRLALWLSLGLQATGVYLILHAYHFSTLLIAGGVFGFGMGGVVPLWGTVVAAAFGRFSIGRVMGLMSPAMIPIHLLGAPFAGWVYDKFYSYDYAFNIFIILYGLAGIFVVFLKLPPILQRGTVRK